jgi:hypothetical protein
MEFFYKNSIFMGKSVGNDNDCAGCNENISMTLQLLTETDGNASYIHPSDFDCCRFQDAWCGLPQTYFNTRLLSFWKPISDG